jgi:pyruvate dehydrogenase E2 component (dihydrolipoamide acetyltransferase)
MAQLELTVPDLGGFDAIPIIEILVKAGETIAKDTPLVTLESDKATMEVPASTGGVVKDIRVKLGDKVSAGTVLLTVESSDVAAAATPPAIASKDAVGAVASEAGASMEAAASVPPAAPSSATAPSATNGTAATNGASNGSSNGASNGVSASPAPAASASTSGPIHASPGIRRFARELGVSLSGVRGSGPNGRVTRDDVQGYVKRALAGGTNGATAAASGFGLGLPAWPVVDFAKFGPIERVALSRIQKISGPALARNWVMIPHVTQNEDADVTELEAFRKQINAERKDVKVTMLAFLMKAAVAALKRYPQVNASLDGDALVLKHYYNLGFAADTPTGLVVPVIKDVDKKGVLEIARETSELAAKARDGKLGPAEMSGATFTISSLGSIGGTTFTPIINAPEVAILGACKAEIRPVWDGAAFVPRLIQPLSFSYDHRVVDGAAAARFCVEIKNALADLRRTLL